MITEKFSNPMIHKAHGILKTLSADEKVRQEAEIREQALINERIFIAGERRKGREEEARNIARKMLAGGLKTDDITKFTGLKAKEIEALKKRES